MALLIFPLLLAPAGAGAQPEVTLRPGFGAPIVVKSPQRLLDMDMERSGVPRSLSRCHNDNTYTSSEPLFRFTVEQPVRAEVALRGELPKERAYYLRLPGDLIECVKMKSRETTRLWEPGEYELHVVIYDTPGYGESVYRGTPSPPGTYTLEFTDLTPPRTWLPAAFQPNPIVHDGLRLDIRSKATADLGVKCEHRLGAGGHTTELPALLLDLQQPWAKLRFRAPLGARALLVTDAKGRAVCSSDRSDDIPYVDLDDVPPGPVEVRVVGPRGGGTPQYTKRHSKGPRFFRLTVEDLARPATPWWGPTTPSLDLTRGMAKPALRGVVPPRNRPVASSHGPCPGHTFSPAPSLLVDVGRPLRDNWLRSAGLKPHGFWLKGPYAADTHRPIASEFKARCYRQDVNHDNIPLGELEPGRYHLHVGLRADQQAPFVSLVFGDEATALDPLVRTGEVPSPLPMELRRLDSFYAMFPRRSEPFGPDLKQAYFLEVPWELFVFPTFDLDDDTAALSSSQGVTRPAEDERRYPLKDEPLLILWGPTGQRNECGVLAADGSVYSKVRLKYLAPRPSGPPAVPTTVRNVVMKWSEAVRLAGPELAKPLASFDAAKKKAQACYSEYWAKHHGGTGGKLLEVTYVNGRVARVEDYSEKVDRRATKRCRLDALDARQDRLFKKLDASYRKRVEATLRRIQARFRGGEAK